MPISFPSNPTTNQTYTYNNKTWQWNGSQWDAVGNVASVAVTSPITNSGTSTSPQLGLNVAALPVNTNAIANGDFSKWTRGTSFTNPADGSYTVDRWINYRDGSGATNSVSQQTFTPGSAPVAGYESAYYLRYAVTVAGSSNTYRFLDHRIEDVRTFAGQTVTFSFWAKADSARVIIATPIQSFGSGGSGDFAATTTSFTMSTSWQRFTGTVAIPSIAGKTIGTNHFLYLRLSLPAGVTMTTDIWGVQLEAGSVATPFKPAGGNTATDTLTSGSAGFDGVLVSTNSATNPSGSGTPAWAGYDVAGKNKIINGGFDFWQRGTSYAAIPGGALLADRWIHEQNGTGNVTASQQTFTPGTAPVAGYEAQYYYRMAVTTTGTSTYMDIFNKMEDVRTFAGQTVTLSFFAKADSARAISVYLFRGFGSGGSGDEVAASDTSKTFSTSWTRYTYTFNLPSIAGKTIGAGSWLGLIIRTSHGSGAVMDIWGVQLEAGSVATPFSRAGGTLQGELAACQRYYQRLVTGGNANAYFGNGWTTTTTSANCFFPTKVTMRTVPTSSEVGGSLQIQDTTNASFGASSAVIITSQSTQDQIALAIGISGATAGRAVFWGASNNASSYFAVSAEL